MHKRQHLGKHLGIILLGLIAWAGCGLKPKPIYFNPPREKRPKATASDSTGSSTKATATAGRTAAADSANIGDVGITADEAVAAAAPADADQAEKMREYSLSSASYERRLANELLPFLDTPYKYGGETTRGVDCSGLVMQVYKKALDIDLPHKAAYQYKMGKAVKKAQLMPGDLVFFHETKSRRIGHVGIYLNEGKFIHSMSGKGVVISKLEEGYWRKYYAGARRIIL